MRTYLKENGIHFFGFLIIFGIMLCNIYKLNFPIVLNDEFGYWGNAVSMAGYDWKNLIAETPYYSWGYSLLLVPIVKFLPHIYWYKSAIVLNFVMLCLTYILAYKFGKKVFQNIDSKILAIIALLVCIYPSNIIYAEESWTETLLYFLMWLVTYLICCLDEEFSMWKYICVCMAFGYMYIVHARCIGLIAAGVFILLLLLCKHKKKKWLVVFFVLFVVFYKLNDVIKQYLLDTAYYNSSASQLNNVGLDTKTISSYFEILTSRLKLICASMGGKLTYVLFSTCFMIGITCIGILNDFKNKGLLKDYFITKMWSLLSLAAMLCISALQMNYWPSRKDIIVYSRYFENALGPTLYIGIVYFLFTHIIKRRHIVVIETLLFIGLIFTSVRIRRAEGGFNSICAPIFGAYYDNIPKHRQLGVWLIVASLIVMLGLIIVLSIQNEKKRVIISLGILAIVFNITCYYAHEYLDHCRIGKQACLYAIRDVIKQDYDTEEIYYIRNEQIDYYCTDAKYVQFLFPDKHINIINRDEIKEEYKVFLVSYGDDEAMQLLEEQYHAKQQYEKGSPRLFCIE